MRQVVQSYRTGALRVEDVPAPRPARGQVLVATRVSLISSGTERQLRDLAKASMARKALARPDLVRRVIAGARREGIRATADKVLARLDAPLPLGYSLSGRVIACGADVAEFAPGDRVACAGAGWANHAEAVVIPKHLCARVPDGVDDTDASFVALGAIALQGVRLAKPTLGERFAVLGLGLIGQLTVQLLKANGCRVLGYDPDPARVALARSLGADAAISEDLETATGVFTRGLGADAVIITAATRSSEPLNAAAGISRQKGRIVVVGMVGMTIDREPFYRRELALILSTSTGPGRYDPSYEVQGHDYPIAYVRWTEQRNMDAFLQLVADGRVTPAALVTHRYAHEDAGRAYDLLESKEPHFAIVLEYAGRPPLETRTAIRAVAPPASLGNAVGFVGCGAYAKGVLLPALTRSSGVELTGVATATGISARAAAERFGFAWAATDPAEVIGDPGTGTVFIATPHDSHAALTVAALDAGKHVFCEKPLAITREEIAAIAEAAGRSSGLLAVGFNRRHAPFAIKAKAVLEPRSSPLVMLIRVNAGPAPSDGWIADPRFGGRIAGEVCHFVDLLTYFAGALPVEVQAAAAGSCDSVSVLLRFADGSTGTIVYSAVGDPALPKEHIEIFAAGCAAQIDDWRRLRISKGGRTSSSTARQDKGARAMVASFLAATRSGQCAPVPLDELVAVTAATLAIEQALGVGGPIHLGNDPVAAISPEAGGSFGR